MPYNFDQPIDRFNTDSVKYSIFDDQSILPLWVADMDFVSPTPVIEAIKARVEHGIFGYAFDNLPLRDILVKRMADLYGWHIKPDDIVWVPGVVTGFNMALRAFGRMGEEVLIQPPVYPPFFPAAPNNGLFTKSAPLTMIQKDGILSYEFDESVFRSAITKGKTNTFLFCNPHNPVGRVWTKEELLCMAEIAIENNMLILSDEIHCDLLFDGHQHIPMASLSEKIAQNTITLMAPSKTFNIAGLAASFAIIQNEGLRNRFNQFIGNVGLHINILGLVAMHAAYEHGDEWLREMLAYLQKNRDITTQFVRQYMPNFPITHPQGTYLSWMDARAVAMPPNGQFMDMFEPFFLEHAKVALNRGLAFGAEGDGFVRINLASRREVLQEALERMRSAVVDR
ncbi:MAG TPA: PatB family C-S lyase [Aggregatilineales bacterium]|nr:PatB family C-S lyase [Aggregatilineales bacterium]